MNTTPVTATLGGKVVHIAEGTGTLCRPAAFAEQHYGHGHAVTCKRCLAKAEKAAPATETPAPAPVATESKGKGKKTPAACACGCELPTGGRYRPGHDARHSGWLARQAIAGELTYDEAMDRLATDALRAKTHRQIERAAAKAAPAA